MKPVCIQIYRAIREGKWLSIEYKNNQYDEAHKTTKYWIAIKHFDDISNGRLKCDGLHIYSMRLKEIDLYIDRIQQEAFDNLEKIVRHDIIISKEG